jgi:iron complex transport system substrate-binding protein
LWEISSRKPLPKNKVEQEVAQAGRIDILSNPAGDSIATSWEKIVKYNPEVLVLASCAFK